jgi:signal transduction histidine kinase
VSNYQSYLCDHIVFGRHRYLFRLFRAQTSDTGIFSKKDRDDLRAACDRLSLRLEREVREFQQKTIRTAATDAFRRLPESTDHYKELLTYLDNSGVHCFLIAVHETGETVPDIDYAVGTLARHVNSSAWTSAELATIIANNDHFDALSSVRITDITPVSRRDLVRQELGRLYDTYDEICLLATRSMNTTTTLLFVRSGARAAAHEEYTGITKNEEDFLLSLLSIYAAAAEAKKSLITADKADHMLADLGHEVGTPVSTLTQTAILACDRAIVAVKSLSPTNPVGATDSPSSTVPGAYTTVAALEKFKVEVNDLGGLVQIITEIPRALAQLGGDQIELDFQVHSWNDLIRDVWKDALDWSMVLDERDLGTGRVSKGSFTLRTSDNLAGKSIVGDRAFLRMAIGNIVKNAMKYSLPRYRHEPMEIGIFLEPQGIISYLNVRNWGVGIPSDSYKRIFGKYERIDRKDRLRTIRGRGIGLYLARSFMRAHGGDLICQSSTPTLDDPSRVQQLEGYETQFR